MTEMMPASAPEEIRSSEEKTGWEDVAETHFAGDENFEEWQAETLAREEEEQKRTEIIELKKKAGRDIAVEVIRNPGKYEEMQSEGEAKIAEIREKVREEWMAKGASAEEAARRAREYDGRMSFFVTAKEAREWTPGKAGVQAVDAIMTMGNKVIKETEDGEKEVVDGYMPKHIKEEERTNLESRRRVGADELEDMDEDRAVEVRMWVDMDYMEAEMKRRKAVRKMQIAKRYEAVAEKMWPGDLDSVKRDAEWKKQKEAEKRAAEERGEEVKEEEEQFFPPVPEKETAEQATARLLRRLAKEEKMLAKDRETLEITLSGRMDTENKRRKVWNEERVKSDEKIVDDIKFQMAKIEETGDPVAAEKALLERWRDQEKAQIEELKAQVKKMRFFQGAKKKETRAKIAELEKRQREYWPTRVDTRLNISHNV